ncbi:hypothetical protein [Parerythrobacter aestuarii]|uniref:hypothetical protein n=1 Tax=Parerythrobacter aestuarii TaxID=3020909 RepID=UPI0024DEED48|nr:hypothetical protein [Parerythrobacter aestuarii]
MSAALLAALPLFLVVRPVPAEAQPSAANAEVSWADLADLSDAAQLVVRAVVKKQAALEAERAAGVAPGSVRLYIEAETVTLISGSVPVGESLRYLVDVPLDARGKVPKLKKTEVILFARPVPSRPGEIQLVARDAQLPWSTELEQRLRPILAALVAPDAPPAIAGVRDALSISGNLAGESETQIFLDTLSGKPLSLSIVRRPGMRPVWGVSYSEIVDQAVRAPQPQTLGWYRLACFLPTRLPGAANLSRDPADRARAEQDYRFVVEQLGPCPRYRTPPVRM